jgi:hypothetical protein
MIGGGRPSCPLLTHSGRPKCLSLPFLVSLRSCEPAPVPLQRELRDFRRGGNVQGGGKRRVVIEASSRQKVYE